MLAPPDAALHPWNVGFDWSLPETEPTTLTAEQKEQFDRQGFVVLDDVVEAELLDAVVAELDAEEAKVDRFLASQPDERFSIAERGALTIALHPVTRSDAAQRLARHSVLLGACADLVGPDVRLYWDQAVYKKPEKPRRVPWHQDNGYTYVEPQHYLTCWVALTDATLDNGCPWIAPGVHRSGTLRHHYIDPLGWECLTNVPDAESAAVGAGGVVVFSSLTPHLTGPNTTTDVRKAYILQYAPEGAVTVAGDWIQGAPPGERNPCADPDRQFAVLANGEPVV